MTANLSEWFRSTFGGIITMFIDGPNAGKQNIFREDPRFKEILSILDDYASLRAELTHAKEVAEGAGYRFEKAEAGRAEALAQLAKLRSTLTELHAIMKGECPGLLRESSGGMEIGLMIEAALKLGEGEK